jgi:hypothetical protein
MASNPTGNGSDADLAASAAEPVFEEHLAQLMAGHEALLSRPNEIDPS